MMHLDFFNCKYFLLQVGEVVVVEVEDEVVEDEVGAAMVVKFREAGVIVPVVMLVVTGIKVVVVMEVVEADHSQQVVTKVVLVVVTKEVVVVTKEVDTRVVEEVIKVAEVVIKVAEEVIKVEEVVIKEVEEVINRVMIKEDIRTVMVVEEGVGEGEGVGGEVEVAEDERSDDTSRLPDKRGCFLINFLIPQQKHAVGTQKNHLSENVLLSTIFLLGT